MHLGTEPCRCSDAFNLVYPRLLRVSTSSKWEGKSIEDFAGKGPGLEVLHITFVYILLARHDYY